MRRALVACGLGMAAGIAYGVGAHGLSLAEGAAVVALVAASWALAFAVVLGGLALVRGLDRPVGGFTVALVVATLVAFPVTLDGQHAGVLPAAEVVRIQAGGSAQWVYFDPDSRVQLNAGAASRR